MGSQNLGESLGQLSGRPLNVTWNHRGLRGWEVGATVPGIPGNGDSFLIGLPSSVSLPPVHPTLVGLIFLKNSSDHVLLGLKFFPIAS